MEIALHNMAEGGQNWSSVDEFISRQSVSMLEYNMKYLWFWDMTGVDGFNSDGPCVFVRFNGGE